MSTLLVVGFPSLEEAEQVRRELAGVQRERLIALEDAVVVDRDGEGHVHLHQALNLTAAGALGGGFWGALVGLLFLNPLLGATVGAGVGGVSGAFADLGIDDGFLREVGSSLPIGGAALCVLIGDVAPDRVLERLRAHAPRARLLRTNLGHRDERRLQAMLERAGREPLSPLSGSPAHEG